MDYLDNTSLAKTIDNVSEALLFGFDIKDDEKYRITDFIVNQHFAPHNYANMFAPTENDLQHDLVLFTGEKIKTGAGKRHMIGEEASRILRKLEIESPIIQKALHEADEGIRTRIETNLMHPQAIYGSYCCKKCSCALWLNLSAGGLNNDIGLLHAGLEFLKQHREEKGTWKGFPYFYTLYVLNEIGPELALDEMRFASKSIHRWLKRKSAVENKYTLRRKFLGEAILNEID